MNLSLALTDLFALVRAGLPLPNFKDKSSVLGWLVNTNDPVAKIITDVALGFETGNTVALVAGNTGVDTLPEDYAVITITRLPDGSFSAVLDHDAICFAANASNDEQVKKLGDGVLLKQLLDAFVQLLPILLPLFVKKDQAPQG